MGKCEFYVSGNIYVIVSKYVLGTDIAGLSGGSILSTGNPVLYGVLK